MAQTKVKLISDGVIVQGNLHASHGITTAHIGEGSNLYYTDARVSSYLSTNSFATESYVGTQIANLVDSSPSALDTLNELASALGDDANFSTTVTNSIALKAPLASPSFTGTATFAGSITTNLSSEGTYFTGGSGGVRQLSITSGTNTSAHALHTFNIASSNGKYEFDINGTTELLLDRNIATFRGQLVARQVLLDSGEKISWGTQGAVSIEGSTGSNQMEFRTGASDRMIINSTGVGIGVTPSTIWSSSYNALQIGLGGSLYAHSSAGNALKLGSNIVYEGTAPNYYDKYLTDSTATKYEQDSGGHIWSIASSGTAGNSVSWSERMRITSGGNVGIGTDDPYTGGTAGRQVLHINGTSSALLALGVGNNLSYLYHDGSNLQITNLASAGGDIIVQNNGAERMRIDSSGVVQVRNQTPTIQLYNTDTSVVAAQELGSIDFYTSDISAARVSSFITSKFNSGYGDSYLSFGTSTGVGAATERMRITSSAECHVELSGTAPTIKATASNGVSGLRINIAGQTSGQLFRIQEDGATKFQINENGKIGIGTTTPAKKMVVMGDIGFGAGNYNGGVYVNNNTSITGVDINWGLEVQRTANTDDYNTRLKYYPGGTARKAGIWSSRDNYFTIYSNSGSVPDVIIPNGNLGIGTTSPDHLLDLYKSTGTTSSATGTTMQRLWNYVGTDLSQQKTFIDFVFQDDNNNEYPQVRIGAEVGQNGDANTQEKEGSGAFVVYTNNATGSTPNTPTNLAERFRVDYSGNVGIGEVAPSAKLTIRQVDDTFNDLDLLQLKRVWSTASGTDRSHGISFNDTNATLVKIYADRTNSGSNYNAALKFLVNSGTNGTSLVEAASISHQATLQVNPLAGSYGIRQNGVSNISNSGYVNGNSTLSINYDTKNQGSMFIECVFNHYGFISNYGCARIATVANGPNIQVNDIQNISSTNGGSWTINRVSNNRINISKTAGTYAGAGHWFINIRGVDVRHT